MSVATPVALALAAASATLTNLAYQREHDAAAALPVLSMRRPLHSLHLLRSDRSWMLGFAMETAGFLLYAAALALAALALVQSIEAGGIGVLAYVSARMGGRHLSRRELIGALVSVFGLAALAVSLAGASGTGPAGLGPGRRCGRSTRHCGLCRLAVTIDGSSWPGARTYVPSGEGAIMEW
jgi:hypothetical protein